MKYADNLMKNKIVSPFRFTFSFLQKFSRKSKDGLILHCRLVWEQPNSVVLDIGHWLMKAEVS